VTSGTTLGPYKNSRNSGFSDGTTLVRPERAIARDMSSGSPENRCGIIQTVENTGQSKYNATKEHPQGQEVLFRPLTPRFNTCQILEKASVLNKVARNIRQWLSGSVKYRQLHRSRKTWRAHTLVT